MYKPITVGPKSGGALATDVSAAEVGIQNYRVKRDFRRYRDREMIREGHDYFWPDRSIDLGDQPLNAGSPVVQIYNAVSQNGKKATIACTRTEIFRYFSEEDATYVSDVEEFNYFEPFDPFSPYIETSGSGTPYMLDTDSPTPYFDADYMQESFSQWVRIGSGFSSSGHRWEILNVGDLVIFNNGVDLPFTYNLSAQAVVPIYELREEGVAAVGTIWAFNDILVLFDITQIKETKLAQIFDDVRLNGTAEQSGAASGGTSHASQLLESNVVNIVSGSFVFDSGMVGKEFRFRNGFKRTILSVDTPTQATLDGEPPHWYDGYPGNIDMRFYILEADGSDSVVVATNPVFLPDMAGKTIIWDSGERRTVLEVLSTITAKVNNDIAVPSGPFSIENYSAYEAIEDATILDRIRYRTLWSAEKLPRRFAAAIPCSAFAGDIHITLDFPAKSLQSGMDITVVGAGLNGGNLLTTIVMISGKHVVIADSVVTTAETTLVRASDMNGSIVGYSDEEADGSAILRAMDLNDQLVIYRETGYQIADYNPVKDSTTGDWQSIFSFSKFVQTPNTLKHRFTLAQVTQGGVNYHLYAGKNNFYRFDMVSRQPVEFDPLRLVKNVFFDQMSGLPSTVTVGSEQFTKEYLAFAASNDITKEVFFCFYSSGEDCAICFDFEQVTCSTTSAWYTAAAMITRPKTPTGSNEEDWFAMGDSAGRVLVYGKANVQQPGWIGNSSSIWTRLGGEYSATLMSGMGSFGYPEREKKVNRYFVGFSSFSPGTTITAKVYGAKNQNATESVLSQKTFPNPQSSNFLPMLRCAYFFSDKLEVAVNGNPLELSIRTYNVEVIDSSGVAKL